MAAALDVLTGESELESIVKRWDGLAMARKQPFSAPAWMLAWWRHVQPEGAAIRALAVSDGDELIGLAPLWVYDGSARSAHYDVMAGRLGPGGPLAAAGREREVIPLMARALAHSKPKLTQLRFEERDGPQSWAVALAESWPRLRPRLNAAEPIPQPIVTLGEGGYEGFLAEKSRSFRRETKRRRSRIEGAGGRFVLAGPAEAERAVDAFLDLHAARWSERGGSTIMVPGIREMLLEAAVALVPADRMRIFLLEVEDRPVAAQLMLTAPGEAWFWQGGFDARWKDLSPLAQTILHAIADAGARGERRIDLGSGGQEYKLRIANGGERASVVKLAPRGLPSPRTRLRRLAERMHEPHHD